MAAFIFFRSQLFKPNLSLDLMRLMKMYIVLESHTQYGQVPSTRISYSRMLSMIQEHQSLIKNLSNIGSRSPSEDFTSNFIALEEDVKQLFVAVKKVLMLSAK